MERLTDGAYCMTPIGVAGYVFVHRLYANLKSKTKEPISTLRKHIFVVLRSAKGIKDANIFVFSEMDNTNYIEPNGIIT